MSQEILEETEALQQRAMVLDLAIQQMLAKNHNMYNFLIAARQLYFIVLAGLKSQLTPEFFSEFLPNNEKPTEEELQLVLNAICQKTAMTPEYPSSVSTHYKFLTTVLLPWIETAAKQEQKVMLQEREKLAEQRLSKNIDLTEKLGEQASIVKRNSVAYFYRETESNLSEFTDAINSYVAANGLSAGFILAADTDFDEHILNIKDTLKYRHKFTSKTIDKLFHEYMHLTTIVPDVLLIDLRGSFILTHTTLKIVDKHLSALADMYGIAIIGIVDNRKLTDWVRE